MRPFLLPSVFKIVRPAVASCIRRHFCAGTILYHDIPKSVRVNVGGSGHVQLNIDTPCKAPETNSNDVLIILPPGPSLAPLSGIPTTFSFPTSILRSLLPCSTLITLEYRLSHPTQPYPFPIHDTATAFTYIASPTSPHNLRRKTPRISLLGTHIGGALALMLALTEPNLIHSLAAIEPLVDWVGLDEPKPKAASKNKQEPQDQNALVHLLRLRSTLFPNPGAYFDPFASPTLFLRAPGRDTPLTHDSPFTEDEDDFPPDSDGDPDTPEAYGPYDDDLSQRSLSPPKRRKVLRRWPPVGRPEEVMLPYTRILVQESKVGVNGILRGQGEEMVDLMRRACFWGREKGLGDGRVGLHLLSAEESGVEMGAKWLKGNLNV